MIEVAIKNESNTNYPSSWEEGYRLGDGCHIKHGYAFKSNLTTIEESALPIVVNIGNFQYDGGFRFGTTKVQRYLGTYPKEYELKPGDILLVMTCQTPRGEILGIPGRVPNDGRTYLHNQRMGLVVLKDPEKLDLGFLYWLFLSQPFNHYLFATSTGAKILHTAPGRIENYRFARPPLPIQRRIAAILSAYDDLVENNARRIAILEEMARNLYREWFVHFRFPGHEDMRMADGVPEGWEMVKLGEVANINELSIRRGQEPDEINYVHISSVSPGRIEKIEKMIFNEAPGRARRVVRHGDTIWSMVRPNRRSYSIILNPSVNLIISTGFAVITPHALPYTYLYLSITTDAFADYLASRTKGAAYPAVSSEDFEEANILLPPDPLLNKFDNLVVDILQQQQNFLRRNEVLHRTRDLLLPRLVSGELDVSELEIAGVDEPSENGVMR